MRRKRNLLQGLMPAPKPPSELERLAAGFGVLAEAIARTKPTLEEVTERIGEASLALTLNTTGRITGLTTSQDDAVFAVSANSFYFTGNDTEAKHIDATDPIEEGWNLYGFQTERRAITRTEPCPFGYETARVIGHEVRAVCFVEKTNETLYVLSTRNITKLYIEGRNWRIVSVNDTLGGGAFHLVMAPA